MRHDVFTDNLTRSADLLRNFRDASSIEVVDAEGDEGWAEAWRGFTQAELDQAASA